jgi:hypothetical protein
MERQFLSEDREMERSAREKSWADIISLLEEGLTTVNGAKALPVVRLARAAVESGLGGQYYAGQSLQRLIVRRSEDWRSSPYVMISHAGKACWSATSSSPVVTRLR